VTRSLSVSLSLLVGLALAAARTSAADPPPPPAASIPNAAALERLSARLAPVELTADVTSLPASERAALVPLVEASKLMDGLYLRQVWAGNPTLLLDLQADKTPLGRARLRAFIQNKGPWLRLDKDQPFLPGIGAKPAAANFYPAGATKAEVEAWLRGLPSASRADAEGFFTTIRRTPAGALGAVPYSVEYQGELELAADLLRAAARATAQPTLRAFLEARAAAFSSNNYYDSDVAWMKLDASVEPTIGPYEVYEDGWFSAKAAFEAYVTIRDDAETAKLGKIAGALQDIEDNLPIDPKLRNPKLGGMAPIRVVNVIFSAGDGNRAVQAAAFNLPNDERIAKQIGTKRTLLKNVQEAKFKHVLSPIARIALAPADRNQVSFDAFFTHILMHELMHGLGPHQSTARDGKTTTVRAALQDAYGPLEEAKADIAGLFALQRLIDKGLLAPSLERAVYTTFLASGFRSLRFGGGAHATGMALQMNTLLDAGGFTVARDGSFTVVAAKIKDAVRALTAEIMTVQATGDRAKAMEMVGARAKLRPEVAAVLAKVGKSKVPVDIEPRFPTADKLLAASARGR